MLGCCLVSFHFLWAILSTSTVPGSALGCRTGNREKLSSTQAEPVQAIKSSVAYFPSISCTTSWRGSLYNPQEFSPGEVRALIPHLEDTILHPSPGMEEWSGRADKESRCVLSVCPSLQKKTGLHELHRSAWLFLYTGFNVRY